MASLDQLLLFPSPLPSFAREHGEGIEVESTLLSPPSWSGPALPFSFFPFPVVAIVLFPSPPLPFLDERLE